MPPFLQFLIRRLLAALISLILITMVLYAGVMLTPPEARASLYVQRDKYGERTASQTYINVLIEQYHLNDPYVVQYSIWARSLVTGSWGYSPTLREDVLPALLRRTPVTLELAFYSLLLLIPLALASGLIAGWRSNRWFDSVFRGTAFLGTSIPPFILAMILISVFYIQLHWFAPGQISVATSLEMDRTGFVEYTGALTLDSLLNSRFDIFLEALRHLAMPVITLSLFHWATLGRITRAAAMDQVSKDYITAARSRGISERTLMWQHALRAILAPVLTATALSAASIVTSLYIVELIFGLTGVSQVIIISMRSSPDAPAAMGFTVYSVIMVIGLMLLLDVVQAIFDPRVRQQVLKP
jgi:peptide/nickel transport system permease protein